MASTDLFIENFKAHLIGGGARDNLFKVILNLEELPNSAKTSFLCKGASLPASNVASIAVPFRGREIKVSGDRTFQPWTVTVINDIDFEIRNGLERLMNYKLNSHATNLGTQIPSTYKRDLLVYQLDKNGMELKEYKFIGAFPTDIAEITLQYAAGGAVEEYQVTFDYDYWTSDTTT